MQYYVFIIDHPDHDNNFTVTVVPINGAGPGEPASEMVQLVFPTPSKSACSLIRMFSYSSVSHNQHQLAASYQQDLAHPCLSLSLLQV